MIKKNAKNLQSIINLSFGWKKWASNRGLTTMFIKNSNNRRQNVCY